MAGSRPDVAVPMREIALSNGERKELEELRRENRTLRMERDILKKAAAFFAKDHA